MIWTLLLLILIGCTPPIYICHKEPPEWAKPKPCAMKAVLYNKKNGDSGIISACSSMGGPYSESDMITICKPKEIK